MSGVPYSLNETEADVGPRPATWLDGTSVTGTVWDNVRLHNNVRTNFSRARTGFPPLNKSDTIWGILSADDGQGSPGKALIVDNTGVIANLQAIGINTTTPTQNLHIVNGNILTTGGTINVGKNEDQTAHFGRGRISHFDITNPNTGVTTSSVSFSHHDCNDGTNFALLQTEDGETLFNSATGKHTEFRHGGLEKMRIHTNGYIGILNTGPTEALDVGGNIRSSGSIEANKDNDSTFYFGRAAIGKVGTTSSPNYWQDQASFAHIDMNTQQDFALKQDHNGYVTLNSPHIVRMGRTFSSQIKVF